MHKTEINDLLLRHGEIDLTDIIKSVSRKSLDKLARILNSIGAFQSLIVQIKLIGLTQLRFIILMWMQLIILWLWQILRLKWCVARSS